MRVAFHGFLSQVLRSASAGLLCRKHIARDDAVLEDLDSRCHGAQLVATPAADYVCRQVMLGETVHDIGHGDDRACNATGQQPSDQTGGQQAEHCDCHDQSLGKSGARGIVGIVHHQLDCTDRLAGIITHRTQQRRDRFAARFTFPDKLAAGGGGAVVSRAEKAVPIEGAAEILEVVTVGQLDCYVDVTQLLDLSEERLAEDQSEFDRAQGPAGECNGHDTTDSKPRGTAFQA